MDIVTPMQENIQNKNKNKCGNNNLNNNVNCSRAAKRPAEAQVGAVECKKKYVYMYISCPYKA